VLAADGRSDNAIAAELAVNCHTVRLWRKRAAQEGLKSLWQIAPGRGHKPIYGPEKIQAIIDAILHPNPKAKPSGAAAPWPSAWE
jgi:transposase